MTEQRHIVSAVSTAGGRQEPGVQPGQLLWFVDRVLSVLAARDATNWPDERYAPGAILATRHCQYFIVPCTALMYIAGDDTTTTAGGRSFSV